VLQVHLAVEFSHGGCIQTSPQGREHPHQLRMTPQSGAVEHRHRLVGREIVAVIDERGELEGGDLSIRGIAGNHIHLAIRQGPVAILTIQELKAKAPPHGWGQRQQVADRVELVPLGITCAHQNRKGVVETQRRKDCQTELALVPLDRLLPDPLGITDGRSLEDRGPRGAGVLDIAIHLATAQRFVEHKGATKIKLSLHH